MVVGYKRVCNWIFTAMEITYISIIFSTKHYESYIVEFEDLSKQDSTVGGCSLLCCGSIVLYSCSRLALPVNNCFPSPFKSVLTIHLPISFDFIFQSVVRSNIIISRLCRRLRTVLKSLRSWRGGRIRVFRRLGISVRLDVLELSVMRLMLSL